MTQVVLGSRLRTPVGEDEKELHRNSMRRELDSALRLAQMSHVTDTSLGNNESCESIETPVMGRRQVNHTETQETGAEQRLQQQVTYYNLSASSVLMSTHLMSVTMYVFIAFVSIHQFIECHKHVN